MTGRVRKTCFFRHRWNDWSEEERTYRLKYLNTDFNYNEKWLVKRCERCGFKKARRLI